MEKGLDAVVADRIGDYVQMKGQSFLKPPGLLMMLPTGGAELIDKLGSDSAIAANTSAKQGLDEMKVLVSLLQAYKVIDKVRVVDLGCLVY